MKGLKLSELETGKMYRDRLSGLVVLVTNASKTEAFVDGVPVEGGTVHYGATYKYFSAITGTYHLDDAVDNQLEPLVTDGVSIGAQ